jgi:hypothetical protein
MSIYKDREVCRLVRPVITSLRCAKCSDGEMQPTGFSQPMSPPNYAHRCNKCGAEEWIKGTTYPRVEYKDA